MDGPKSGSALFAGLTPEQRADVSHIVENSDFPIPALAAFHKRDHAVCVVGLILCLEDEERPMMVRKSAATKLGELGDPVAIPALVKALRDVVSAAEALGKMGDAAVDALLAALDSDETTNRERVAWALGATQSPRAIKPLIDLLVESKGEARDCAGMGLGRIGELAVPALSELLADVDPGVSCAAIRALGSTRSPAACRVLIDALTSMTHGGPGTAVRSALYHMGEEIAPELMVALAEGTPGQRAGAAAVLGRFKHAEAVVPLLKAMEHESVRVRESSARALGKLGAPEAEYALFAALDDTSEEVRSTAAYALSELPAVVDQQALLVRLLGDCPKVRAWCVRALGKTGDEAYVPALEPLARAGEEPLVRRQAVLALGAIGDPVVFPVVRDALAAEDHTVRQAAVMALPKLGRAEAVPLLIEILTAPRPASYLLRPAVTALGETGDVRAAEALVDYSERCPVHEKDHLEGTVAGLGEIAIPYLLEALRGDDASRRRRGLAQGALRRLGLRAVEPLIRELEHTSDREKSWRLCELLQRITRHRGDWTAAAWRKWWEENRPVTE